MFGRQLTKHERQDASTGCVNHTSLYVLHLRAGSKAAGGIIKGTGHDILDFCEQELVTWRGGGVEMKMAIILLVKPRWNLLNISDFQRVFSGKYVSLSTFIESDAIAEIFVFR